MKFLEKIIKQYKRISKNFQKKSSSDSFNKILKNFIRKNRNKPEKGNMLFWELGGEKALLKRSCIFSVLLRLRGYKCRFLVCDGTPGACIQRCYTRDKDISKWLDYCEECQNGFKEIAEKYDAELVPLSEIVDQEKLEHFNKLTNESSVEDILKYEFMGVPLGELVWGSLVRYMKGLIVSNKDINSDNEQYLRKFFFAGLVNIYAANQAFDKFKPNSLVSSNGIYVDYAPGLKCAAPRGINAINSYVVLSGYGHYFSVTNDLDQFQFKSITAKSWEERTGKDLTVKEEKKLDQFFHERYFKNATKDILAPIHPESPEVIKQKLGITNNNPAVCLFSHVSWDGVLGLEENVFSSSSEWLIESIKKMSEIKDINWIIKAHPYDFHLTLVKTSDVIKKSFNKLPDHIKFIEYNDNINTYGLYDYIHTGITMMGTVGAELPMFKKPCIGLGKSHFSDKGFCINVNTKEEYFDILENIKEIKPLTDEQYKMARIYAYSYFVERQIPFRITQEDKGINSDLDLNKLNMLLPGKDRIIDKICDGIINGKDILLDQEDIETL